MATYTKRKGSWYALVRRKGHKTIGRSFDTKADAEKWALTIVVQNGRRHISRQSQNFKHYSLRML